MKYTKQTKATLAKIDSDYERIYTEMLVALSDEAHDIGDAANADDLLSNRTANTHDYQTDVQFLEALSTISQVPLLELMTAFIDMSEVNR